MLFFVLKGLTALLSENAPRAMKENDIKTVSCGYTIQGTLILIPINPLQLFGRKVAIDASM